MNTNEKNNIKIVNKIDEGVYFLKGTRSSNIYYFDFDKKAIIDTGHPLDFENNFKSFEENNLPLDKIDYIVNTHSHCDHVGGNAFLKKMNPAIKILGSTNTPLYLKLKNRTEVLKEIEDDFDEYLIDEFIFENDRIDLGGCILQVIENPGHTTDSLSFFIEKKGYLFCGDLIYKRVITQLDYYQDLNKSLEELISSYKKIHSMRLNVFFTSHGESINDIEENLSICMKKLEKFRNDYEMLLINNLIPSIEHYIYKKNKIFLQELKEFFFEAFKVLIKHKFINLGIDRYENIFNKAISMMLLLNIIMKNEKDMFYLANEVNQYIGIKKIK